MNKRLEFETKSGFTLFLKLKNKPPAREAFSATGGLNFSKY
jgi:hypothetical protein